MATYSIKAPDGNSYQIDGPDGASDEDVRTEVLKQHPNAGGQAAQPQQQAQPAGGAANLMGLPDAATHFLSGAVAAPVAGFAGLGTMAGRALGLTQRDPADVVNSVQSSMTYQPRTEAGQAVTNAVSYPFQKYAQGANWLGGKVTDLTGSPALGTAVDTGVQAIPMVLGARMGAARGANINVGSQLAPEAQEAVGAGLKLTPQQAGGTTGRLLEGLVNSAKLERVVSKANAPTINRGVNQQFGIDSDVANSAALDQAAQGPLSVYREMEAIPGKVAVDPQFKSDIASVSNKSVGGNSFAFDVDPAVAKLRDGYANLSDFTPADAVGKIRQLRAEARQNKNAPYNPERQTLGRAQGDIADALENQLERYTQATPGLDPTLVNRYRDARRSLAQINNAQDAIEGSNYSPSVFAKAIEKKVPLGGYMGTVGRAANNFPRAFQDTSSIRNNVPFGVLEGGIGAYSLFAHNPAIAAAMLARPALRSGMATQAGQSLLLGQNNLGVPLSMAGLPAASEQARVSNDPFDIPVGLPALSR